MPSQSRKGHHVQLLSHNRWTNYPRIFFGPPETWQFGNSKLRGQLIKTIGSRINWLLNGWGVQVSINALPSINTFRLNIAAEFSRTMASSIYHSRPARIPKELLHRRRSRAKRDNTFLFLLLAIFTFGVLLVRPVRAQGYDEGIDSPVVGMSIGNTVSCVSQ